MILLHNLQCYCTDLFELKNLGFTLEKRQSERLISFPLSPLHPFSQLVFPMWTRGNFGQKEQNSPKLHHVHSRFHCNANEKMAIMRPCKEGRGGAFLMAPSLGFGYHNAWFNSTYYHYPPPKQPPRQVQAFVPGDGKIIFFKVILSRGRRGEGGGGGKKIASGRWFIKRNSV